MNKHLISEYPDFAENEEKRYEIEEEIEDISNTMKKIEEQLDVLII